MFYLSKPFPCSYYDDREAQYIVLDPKATESEEVSDKVYTKLNQNGFRRSGSSLYRPHCGDCNACQSLKINVNEFAYKKRFKRTLKNNDDVYISLTKANTFEEHFDLYTRYQKSRHDKGTMLYDSIDDYQKMLIKTCVSTFLMEIRLKENQQLIAVAITDSTHVGLSAMYTFYDPNMPKRSLGILAILKQIELCRKHNLKWLYLGYWIDNHPKMAYKTDFNPHLIFKNEEWI